jgi:hypothetical protein
MALRHGVGGIVRDLEVGDAAVDGLDGGMAVESGGVAGFNLGRGRVGNGRVGGNLLDSFGLGRSSLDGGLSRGLGRRSLALIGWLELLSNRLDAGI